MSKLGIIKLVFWFFGKVLGTPRAVIQTREQQRRALSLLWTTQSIREWIGQRERYLIDAGMEKFIEGKLENARGLSGQLLELRALKGLLSSAWAEEQQLKRETERERKLAIERKSV
jgi:hypothetical protein